MVKFRQKQVILYHTTKLGNLPAILKEGLKVSHTRPRPWDIDRGLSWSPVIYTSVNPKKLTKPYIMGKTVVLKITLPWEVFESLKHRQGDPEYDLLMKKYGGDQIKFAKDTFEVFKKYNPKLKEMSFEEFIKSGTDLEWASPDNCICFYDDIDPRYITIYKK